MIGIEYVTMTGAVLAASGGLWCAWSLLIALKESIKSAMKAKRNGTPGVAPRLNLSGREAGAMHYGENIVASQGCPTTHVEGDFNQEEYKLPSGDYTGEVLPGSNNGKVPPHYGNRPISKTKAGIHFPLPLSPMMANFLARLEHLEANATLADAQRWNMAGDAEKRLTALEENAKQAADNMSKAIIVLEKMTNNMLGRDKRIAEVEDRLRDSIFILYGGKKPNVE